MPITPVPYIVVVDRRKFTVTVRKRRIFPRRFVPVDVYSCAIGAEGYETPGGYYELNKKKLNPTWTPPDSDWVGPELRDPETGKPKTLAADDPNNPLAGAFLHVIEDEAIGIHGTKNVASLGSKASHGCIRVHPDVAVHLYRILPLYTPIIIQ